MPPAVYLDYNATAPLRPEVASAIREARGAGGNASSVHGFGREQRRRIEQAREAVAALAGAPLAGVVFTGSGSEANNLALLGCGRPRRLVSAGEHESLLQAANFIQTIQERQGLKVACLEEIAYRRGYLSGAEVERLAHDMRKNSYGEYLLRLVRDDEGGPP